MDAEMSRPSDIAEHDIAALQFCTHRAEIIKCLPIGDELLRLVHRGIQVGLLEMGNLESYRNPRISVDEKRQNVIASTEQKENGHSKFLQCIQSLNEHMGYQYIISLLEDRKFAEKSEIEESTTFRERIIKNMSKIESINLEMLCPILASKNVITSHELLCLTDKT